MNLMDSSLTPAQQDALEKAYSLLGEHFDSVLIGVLAETTTPNSQEEAFRCCFKGGFTTAIGLASRCHDRLLHEQALRTEEE